jgi:hypothetical protein
VVEAGRPAKAQLLFALAILVAFAAVLAAGRDSEAPAPAAAAGGDEITTEKPDPRSLARLSVELEPRVARRVARLRGLEFEDIPEPEVVDSEFLNRLGAREGRRTNARAGIAADEAELRILGLIEPDEQLESIFGATGDLAAAAYDPRTDRMYVVSDSVSADPALVEFVLAHELNHALEDQRFSLREEARLDDDAALASLALTEGTATALMVEYATQFIGAGDLLGATSALGAEDAGVPKFFLDQTTWTYMGGARFVAALRELGGGWKLVDHALAARPPATTEQVLHVEKYVRDEPAQDVALADDTLRAGGWQRTDAGVVGELTTSQLLEVGIDTATAERAAAGWGGDRYELWRQDVSPGDCEHPCRQDFVLVIRWAMDSEEEANELADAVVGYLDSGLDGTLGEDDTWQLDDGYAAAGVAGDEVALVFAPDRATAVAVGSEQLAP